MKLTEIFIFFISFSLILGSCKKEEVPDPPHSDPCEKICSGIYDSLMVETETRYSGESSMFIAAYPESWWVFSSGDSLECVEGSSAFRELMGVDNTNCTVLYKKIIWSGPKIVGLNSNSFTLGLVDGDQRIKGTYPNNMLNIERVINTNYIQELDSNYWRFYSYSEKEPCEYGSSRTADRRLLDFHETYELPGGLVFENVAEIESSVHVNDKYTNETFITYYYYAQEVGLIRYFCPEDEYAGFPEYDIYLTDYYIAPH